MQKIWIRGQTYELQEIYGMEAGRPAGDVVEGVEAGEVRDKSVKV